MKKIRKDLVNYIIDSCLAISLIIMLITGIIKFPGFLTTFGISPQQLPSYEISLLHDWIGLLFLFFLLVHFILHLHWFSVMNKKFINQLKTNKKQTEALLITGFIILVSILTVFSYIFLDSSAQSGIPFIASDYESIDISGIGIFSFNTQNISSIRSDIFKPNHFSLFDILIHLDKQDKINLSYYFDNKTNTHIIDAINGKKHWWYEAYYDGGWPENNVFRMDHYPYKPEMTITLFQTKESILKQYYNIFEGEIHRKNEYNNSLIIPEVIISGRKETLRFQDVTVTAHNLREDMFQQGVITAIDVIMSLGDEDLLTYDLQWYESIGTARVVRNYFVDRINEDQSVGRCGFVYEEGSKEFSGFRGNHIHIPADIRVLNTPEYEEWYWICL